MIVYSAQQRQNTAILRKTLLNQSNKWHPSNSTAVSDLMASKVCPVCKTFSSTSNTTLNAHMDQCLSTKSDIFLVVDKNLKLNVKPKKKKLLTDIYANAPGCTLEDLDRRNGRSWATDINLATPNIESNAETKKPKLSQVVVREDNRNEGQVYVDSNRIKLRILSKISDATQVVSREEFRPEKHVKVVRDEKSLLISKRKYFATKYLKKLKFKFKEKPRSLKLRREEIQATQGLAFHEETNQMEDRLLVLSSNEQDPTGSYNSADFQKCCCSKRSDIRKNFGNIDFFKGLEQSKTATEMEMLQRRKPSSDTDSAAKRNFSNYSRSTESITVDSPLKTVRKMDIWKSSMGRPLESTSTNVLHLKRSRKSGPFVSSIGRTREDIGMELRQKSDMSPEIKTVSNEKCYLQHKKEVISPSRTRRLSKHRLFPGPGKTKWEFYSFDCSERERSAENAVIGRSEEQVIHQNLNSGTEHCQIAEQKSSEVQVENSTDGNSIVAKSVNNEDQGHLSYLNDRHNLMIPMQEIGMPMKQMLLDEQEKERPDENVCRGMESEATSAQESSVCLTSHGDLGPDIPIENSWIPSASFVPNQENNLIVRELSRSPSSSASTISPASPKEREPLHIPSFTKGNSSLLSPFSCGDELTQRTTVIQTHQQFCMDSTLNKPQRSSDHQNLFPNLYLRPNNSIDSYPNLQTDPVSTPVLESPRGSVLSRAFNDFGSSPSCGTPTHSSSNSILRLMGKNLMVVNSEESAQIPKIQSSVTDNNSNDKNLPSNFSFSSYPIPKLETHMQNNMNHKACVTKEVNFIDDSANEDIRRIAALPPFPISQTVFQAPLPYFRPPIQLLRPFNGLISSNLIHQGSSFDDPASLLPSSFLFKPPSASHMNPSLYYPQSLM